jgi:hypothetical protein
MEELKASSAFTRKEKIILALTGIVALAVLALTIFWVYQKFKPVRQEKKISIANLAEDNKKYQEVKVVKEDEKKAQEPQEKIQPPEEIIAPEKIDVKVLNGGAAGGTATKVKDALTKAGFTKIEADNTKISGYKAVAIYYKKEFSDQIRGIKEIMKTTYGIIETKEGMNEKEMAGDIVIILGK